MDAEVRFTSAANLKRVEYKEGEVRVWSECLTISETGGNKRAQIKLSREKKLELARLLIESAGLERDPEKDGG